jgi:RNA polymerase sigma-70 factor, ECF subfamily
MKGHAREAEGSLVDDMGFEAIVATHHGEIYRYLLRATGRKSDADDLSQETFLRAYRAFQGLPKDANTRAWLFAIATNLSRNHFRSLKRRRRAYEAAGLLATERDGHATPDGMVVGWEMGVVVATAVGTLPPKQRLAFLQRKIHGLDYDAIGVSLGCSADSARAHVFQALKKIRRALDGPRPLAKESSQ